MSFVCSSLLKWSRRKTLTSKALEHAKLSMVYLIDARGICLVWIHHIWSLRRSSATNLDIVGAKRHSPIHANFSPPIDGNGAPLPEIYIASDHSLCWLHTREVATYRNEFSYATARTKSYHGRKSRNRSRSYCSTVDRPGCCFPALPEKEGRQSKTYNRASSCRQQAGMVRLKT